MIEKIDFLTPHDFFSYLRNGLTQGGSAYKAIGDRLVLKSSADLAFSEGAEKFLKDKELKSKKTEVDTVEADWSKAHKDVMRAKLSLTESEMEKLAKEQLKNKLLSQCLENGKKFKYDSPVSSQNDVNKSCTTTRRRSRFRMATARRRISDHLR